MPRATPYEARCARRMWRETMASLQTTTQHDRRQGFHSDTVALPALAARHRVPLRQIEATRLTKTNTSDVDAAALAAELRRHVRGEVRFDDGSRALYATDGSNYRQVPIGVVLPRDIDDIMATVATARRYGAPVLARGGGHRYVQIPAPYPGPRPGS